MDAHPSPLGSVPLHLVGVEFGYAVFLKGDGLLLIKCSQKTVETEYRGLHGRVTGAQRELGRDKAKSFGGVRKGACTSDIRCGLKFGRDSRMRVGGLPPWKTQAV